MYAPLYAKECRLAYNPLYEKRWVGSSESRFGLSESKFSPYLIGLMVYLMRS